MVRIDSRAGVEAKLGSCARAISKLRGSSGTPWTSAADPPPEVGEPAPRPLLPPTSPSKESRAGPDEARLEGEAGEAGEAQRTDSSSASSSSKRSVSGHSSCNLVCAVCKSSAARAASRSRPKTSRPEGTPARRERSAASAASSPPCLESASAAAAASAALAATAHSKFLMPRRPITVSERVSRSKPQGLSHVTAAGSIAHAVAALAKASAPSSPMGFKETSKSVTTARGP
mmetsp:Transcript_18200/g.63986  ORF Transcript_18200/g.63986 Transcript_18200/m.63986 type:complete len:231 (+) Transcript_18200:880-1572(+)